MHISHDIHTHNLYSGCCYDPEATTQACVRHAMELGHTVFGISNHLWDESVPGASRWYQGQPISYGAEMKYAFPADTGGMKLLFGVETEYCGMTDTLGMRAEHAGVFDYVLVPHSHLHMRNFVIAETEDVRACRAEMQAKLRETYPELPENTLRKMVSALSMEDMLPLIPQPRVDYARYLTDFLTQSLLSLLRNPELRRLAAAVPVVIAHPLAPSACGNAYWQIVRSLDRDQLWECCREAAALNVAFDVNLWTFRIAEQGLKENPMGDVMRLARSAGVKFTFGTDAHRVCDLDNIRAADDVADAIGLEPSDLCDIVRV